MNKAKKNFSNKVYQQHDIKFIKIIGQGNWSDVYLAYNLDKTEKYAVKVIAESVLAQTPKLKQLVQAEKNILKNCQNPNIVTYYRDFREDEHLFMVLQFCNGGDLGELLDKQDTISQGQAIKYLYQILNGFQGLHSVNAMHRDFKVQNVMLHDDCCKIVDLGFGKQLASLDQVTQTKLGSQFTMAPEVMKRQPYGIKADIWSIGVVFYQLLQGNYPFVGRSIDRILQKIQNDQIVFSKEQSPEAIDFIKRCLVVDPLKRIDWKQIYEHELLSKLGSNRVVNNSKLLGEAKEENRKYYSNKEGSRIQVQDIYKMLDSKEQHVQQNISRIQTYKKQQIKQQQLIKKGKQKLQEIQQEQINPMLKSISNDSSKEQSAIKLESQFEQIDTNNYKQPNSPFNYQMKKKQQRVHKQQPLQEQEYFKLRLKTTRDKYIDIQRNCYYVAEILHQRYLSIKRDLPNVNHQAYLAILWKDSYMKLAQLVESLQSRRNIFHEETIELFFAKHRQDFINAFRGLLNQAKQQFDKMVEQAKQKKIMNYNIFISEAANIEKKGKVNKKSWMRYVSDVVEQYCCDMAAAWKAKQNYANKLLIYIFCLREVARQPANALSTEKVSQMIRTKKIDYFRVENDIKRMVNINNFQQYDKPIVIQPKSLRTQHNQKKPWH